MQELETVKVIKDIPELRLKKGAIGAVVHVHTSPRLAYMVEFSDKLGRTNALYSLLPEQIQKAEITSEERKKYLGSGNLPYNSDDSFCVDPDS